MFAHSRHRLKPDAASIDIHDVRAADASGGFEEIPAPVLGARMNSVWVTPRTMPNVVEHLRVERRERLSSAAPIGTVRVIRCRHCARPSSAACRIGAPRGTARLRSHTIEST